MRDRYGTSDTSGRVVVEGCRIIRNGAVQINRELYSGPCLVGHDGEVVVVRVYDAWGLEYRVTFEDGKTDSITWKKRDAK